MASVFVLESGDYSERYTVGIFSTREKAESVKVKRANEDDNDVEEWPLDKLTEYENGPTFHARVNCATGDIGYTGMEYDKIFRHPRECVVHEYMGIWNSDDMTPVAIIDVHSPISMEHAVKVAAEKRQERLRTQA